MWSGGRQSTMGSESAGARRRRLRPDDYVGGKKKVILIEHGYL